MTPFRLAFALLLILAIHGCGGGPDPPELAEVPVPPPVPGDLAAIEEAGELRVLFTYNSTGYFVYRGEVMGFEFRLLRAFAKDRDLDLRPIVVRDRSQILVLLNEGTGDVAAARLLAPELGSGPDRPVPSRPLYTTPPSLVQQIEGAPDPLWPEPVEETLEEGAAGGEIAAPEAGERRERRRLVGEPVEIRARLVTRPEQLAGETVHVEEGSPYRTRLAELEDEVSGDIRVVEVEGVPDSETLIRRIAAGPARFTVAPRNVARLQEDYFVNIEVLPVLGPPNEVVWAVRRTSPELQAALDDWLGEHPDRIAEEYDTYFEDREGFRERVASEYLTSATGRLSPYDELIREQAAKLGWDWRLLASQAFQESRFDPRARSWAGAVGLLQIMPATGREVGVEDLRDPAENVAGAVRYLDKLDRFWRRKLPDVPEAERVKFVLASYNVGYGHVQDARRLAEKHGGDDADWETVALWLVRKSEREVYTDPVVRYGFARGLEPVTYVELILERYGHYLETVEREPGTGAAAGSSVPGS